MYHAKPQTFYQAICCTILGVFSIASFAQGKPLEVALTFDDLPFVTTVPDKQDRFELIKNVVAVLSKHKIKGVYAFVNGKRADDDPQGMRILRYWVRSGHYIGNHTYSHPDLNLLTSADYTANIDSNEKVLRHFAPAFRHFFRYPFLHEGNTQEKRDTVRAHLFRKGYAIAQVTSDFSDWVWNDPYIRCLKNGDTTSIAWLKEVMVSEAVENMRVSELLSDFLFGRQIKHIALIHPFALSVDRLDAILTSWENHGVKFIPFKEAVSDTAYAINPNVVRDFPYTFLNQIRLMRALQNPVAVKEIYQRSYEIEKRLGETCI